MKRWIGALIATALACIPILFARVSSQSLFLDTDTKFILLGIRSKNSPFGWFFSDWPLGNHFYRPVSTLSFELDNRLFHDSAAGYGLTNALLCVACVFLLLWLLREITDNPLVSGLGAALFALQSSGHSDVLLMPLEWAAIAIAILGAMRHGLRVLRWLPAPLVLWYAIQETAGGASLAGGTIGWLPGRTATVMTVFTLASMAAYARYERTSATRAVRPITAVDLPATRTSIAKKAAGPFVWLWGAVSVLCAALAFGAYEQAVMLPAELLAVAITMKFSGFRVRWGWQAAFWSLLVGYLAVRHAVIPAGVSSYQAQQYRHGPGVWLSLLDYAFPALNTISGFIATLDQGWFLVMNSGFYLFFVGLGSNITAFYQARRRWVWALAGYGMSFIAFLPMAWVKQFPHYSYWPLAMRSLFTVTLLLVAGELTVSAWSPPSRQAPKRLDPAPGSLPRL